MGLQLTSVRRKALVFGVSAIVHGAAFFASRVEAGGAVAGATQPPTLEIQIEPETPLDPLEEARSTARADPAPLLARVPAIHEPPRLERAAARMPIEAPAPIPTEARAPVATDAPAISPDPALHFVLAISSSPSGGAVSSPPSGAGAAGPRSTPPGGIDDFTPLPEQAVDIPARLLRSEIPTYPADALAERVEADVRLELVVSREGTVESVRPLHSSGHGLDEAAARAARRFRFTPAVKYGRPVRARVSWTVQFRLR
jgi:TonB family protein